MDLSSEPGRPPDLLGPAVLRLAKREAPFFFFHSYFLLAPRRLRRSPLTLPSSSIVKLPVGIKSARPSGNLELGRDGDERRRRWAEVDGGEGRWGGSRAASHIHFRFFNGKFVVKSGRAE